MIIIKQMNRSDIHELSEIDRSERVRLLYRYEDGNLVSEKVDIQVPRWRADGVERHIKTLSPMLEKGGVFLGALDGDLLVGIAVLGYRFIGENLDQVQLAFLHVSKAYRRQGIATRLMIESSKIAKGRGAKYLYISATESESAVGFYSSQGCILTPKVDKELYALEPKDIHMIKEF